MPKLRKSGIMVSSPSQNSCNPQKVSTMRGRVFNLVFSIILITILFFKVSITFVHAAECETLTQPENVPCTVTSNVLNCSDYTANITNTSTNIFVDVPLIVNGDGTYSLSFNQSSIGNYNVIFCDGSVTALTINYKAGYLNYVLITLSAILVFFFLIIGFMVEDELFVALSGMVLIIIGIYFVQNGWANVSNWFVQAVCVIIIGIGVYLLIVPYLKKWSGW